MSVSGPRQGRLEAKAVRGVPWTVLTFASSKVFGLTATIVLARLLTPADFGIVALATLTIGALSLFSDLGLGGALVVRQDLDEVAKGTILTLLLATGAITAALTASTATLVASLFDQPRLAGVLLALSVTLLLGGPVWFYETLMQRELEFGKRFKAMLAQSAVGAVVSISSAALGAGVWSLVAGQVAGVVVYATGLLALAPYRIRPALDRAAARDVVLVGRGFLAQGGIGFLELNADNLAVGRLLGAAQLGLYSLAFRLSELAYWAITEPVARVTFPGFARMASRGESVRTSFLSVLQLVTLVACPVGALLSATASPFVGAVLGDAWLPMAGPLSILGVWGTLNHFEATLGWLLNSVSQAGLNARISALAMLALIPGVLLAAKFGDLNTVAWVVLGHAVLSVIARAVAVKRAVLIPLADQWAAVRPAAGGAIMAWAGARTVVNLTSGSSPALSLVLSTVTGAGAYLATVSIVEPGVLARARRQLRPMFARSAAATSPSLDA